MPGRKREREQAAKNSRERTELSKTRHYRCRGRHLLISFRRSSYRFEFPRGRDSGLRHPTTSIQNASARLPERSRIQPLTARNSIVFWVDLAASSDQRVRQESQRQRRIKICELRHPDFSTLLLMIF